MSDRAMRFRRILAARTGWPAGAVEVCERLELEHPGWELSWFPEWKVGEKRWHREAGFYAWRSGQSPLVRSEHGGYVQRSERYGADAAAIEQAIAPTESAHLPRRPTWDCEACGERWPCATAREELAAENDRDGLAVLMCGHLEEFAADADADAGGGPLTGAFDRFIRWTRPTHATAPDATPDQSPIREEGPGADT